MGNEVIGGGQVFEFFHLSLDLGDFGGVGIGFIQFRVQGGLQFGHLFLLGDKGGVYPDASAFLPFPLVPLGAVSGNLVFLDVIIREGFEGVVLLVNPIHAGDHGFIGFAGGLEEIGNGNSPVGAVCDPGQRKGFFVGQYGKGKRQQEGGDY